MNTLHHHGSITGVKTRICQRCGEKFECHSGSILQCQCQTVELTQRQRDTLALHYDDCLCVSCLRVLQDEQAT